MSDTPEWDGGPLGPYRVGKRYRSTGLGLGRLFQAHHLETGAPAVVLMPGRPGDWRPLGGWTVRVTSQSVPPFLALEVEQAPGNVAGALQELTMLLQRLSTAMARLEDRPDANAHLTLPVQPQAPEPKPPPPRRRGLLLGAWAFAMASLAGAAVLLGSPPPEPAGEKHAPALAGAAIVEPFSFADLQDDSPPVIGYPMPDAPIKGQRKAPCPHPSVEIRGGCWVPLEYKPPCPISTAEHEGKCYMPVSEKKPEPRALLP